MNKATFLFTIIVITLFASCSQFEYRESLTLADSMASINPKKAIAMLDSISQEMQNAPEYEQMYYKLLCIKAADKAYINQTSDSTILTLVKYYETDGDKKLLPEAYYYTGRVYRDLHDAPRALMFYQKAMNLIPENNKKKRSSIYNHMGRLFSNQHLYDESIRMYLKSYQYDVDLHDTINIIYSLRDLAYTYNKVCQKDSSLHYYEKAYIMAKRINNDHMKNIILAQMASFYIEQHNYKKAKECLKPSLDILDSINISANYAMALKICMNTGQYDSAHFYAKELLTVGTIYAKQTATRCLTELALREKDYENIAKYLKMFNEYTDSVKVITATESVNRMNSLYNYNLREKENLTLKAENANKKLLLTITASVVFALFMILVGYVYRNRQKQKLQTERLKRLKKELYEQSEEYIQQNKEKINALEQELKKASDENHLLAERIEEQRADLMLANETAIRKQARNASAKARMEETDIYKTIQEHIKKDKIINMKVWNVLDEIINQEVADFKENIYSYYNISQHEYHICMLIRLDILPKDMATLLGCTTSAVSKARKRLQEKFFSDEGTAKDFDNFINSL